MSWPAATRDMGSSWCGKAATCSKPRRTWPSARTRGTGTEPKNNDAPPPRQGAGSTKSCPRSWCRHAGSAQCRAPVVRRAFCLCGPFGTDLGARDLTVTGAIFLSVLHASQMPEVLHVLAQRLAVGVPHRQVGEDLQPVPQG